jgi:hypothetical protein
MLRLILPKRFCCEFVFCVGPAQLITFMSVVLGIKPLMDLWVSKDKLKDFQKICKKYKLYWKANAIFTDINDPQLEKTAIGKEVLTTTKARGFPPEAKINGEVHLFVAKKKSNLEAGFKNGWYPLVVKNRVINKPYVDLVKFGYNLGYPDCCVKFFQKYNDWRYYSHLYEIFKNTKGKPSFLANPLTRIISYSYIAHLPCSFNCPATIKKSKKLRALIQKREPEFIKEVDKILKSPFLVFYEDIIYGFEGKIIKNHLFYQKVYFLGGDLNRNFFQSKLERGNHLFVKERKVIILKNNKFQTEIVISKTKERPIIPFLIQFQ